MSEPRIEDLETALRTDMTIDIVTTGARSGQLRRIEIWFMNVDGEVIITGTVRDGRDGSLLPRDWLANMFATPEFTFCLKESVVAEVPARAHVVRDPAERRRLMTAPATSWYREQGDTLDGLLESAPIVSVEFLGDYTALNG